MGKITINSIIQPLHLGYLRGKYKAVPDVELQGLAKCTKWSDGNANKLTKCIIKFFEYSGIYATRIQTQGQARVKKFERFDIISGKLETQQKVTYTKSTTKIGTADIHAIYNGLHLSIEVKYGADKMSAAQKISQQAIENSGGIYYLAKDFLTFYEWFTTAIKREVQHA